MVWPAAAASQAGTHAASLQPWSDGQVSTSWSAASSTACRSGLHFKVGRPPRSKFGPEVGLVVGPALDPAVDPSLTVPVPVPPVVGVSPLLPLPPLPGPLLAGVSPTVADSARPGSDPQAARSRRVPPRTAVVCMDPRGYQAPGAAIADPPAARTTGCAGDTVRASSAMAMTSTQTLLQRSALLLAGALACSAGPAGTTTDTTGDTGTSTAAQPTSTGATSTSTASASSPTTSDPSSDPSSSDPTTSDPSSASTSSDPTASTTTGAVDDTGTSTGPDPASTSSTGDGSTTTADTSGSSGTTGAAEGLGVLSGECGLLDAMELESPQAFVFSNAIDLGVDGFDEALLTPGGMQMIAEGGLNDGSLKSEIVAYEVLARCDMASLLKTEGKIVYTDPMGKKTDILVELDGLKVGVSVVRALGFPKEDPYTVAQATTILKKKLGDIQISSANVAPEDAWVKQILSVVAYGPMHVESVLTAYDALDAQLKADTILVVTVTNGDDSLLY